MSTTAEEEEKERLSEVCELTYIKTENNRLDICEKEYQDCLEDLKMSMNSIW